MFFKINMPVPEEEKKEFSISSQHYDFLPPLMTGILDPAIRKIKLPHL